jgi:hypothetical protein
MHSEGAQFSFCVRSAVRTRGVSQGFVSRSVCPIAVDIAGVFDVCNSSGARRPPGGCVPCSSRGGELVGGWRVSAGFVASCCGGSGRRARVCEATAGLLCCSCHACDEKHALVSRAQQSSALYISMPRAAAAAGAAAGVGVLRPTARPAAACCCRAPLCAATPAAVRCFLAGVGILILSGGGCVLPGHHAPTHPHKQASFHSGMFASAHLCWASLWVARQPLPAACLLCQLSLYTLR